MIRAVIVEDEGVAARKLQQQLEAQGVQVLESLRSNRGLQAFLEGDTTPDLYFMDIHLSDGIVFDTLQATELEVPIIFTTAYDEYAIRAFKQRSIDYLLKPIDSRELREALEKYRSMFQPEIQLDWQLLGQLVQGAAHATRERIRIKTGHHLRSVKLRAVPLLFSEHKLTFVLLENGRSYPIDFSLEGIYAELDPSQFFRANRQQIVNIEFIEQVVTYSGSRLKVQLTSKEQPEIVVARERVADFKAWLG